MNITDSADDIIRIPGGPARRDCVRGRGMNVTLCHVVLVVAAARAVLLVYVASAMSRASYRR
jgi:hypothetical protein